MTPHALARRLVLVIVAVAAAGAAGLLEIRAATGQEPSRHELTIKVKKHEFSQKRIEVAQGDIVKITLIAEDVPHSFTVDQFRIAKRAVPGKPVTFEFRADRAGTFPFYCNLTGDDPGCKDTRGELVVAARQP